MKKAAGIKKPTKKFKDASLEKPKAPSYSFFEDVYDVVRQIPKGRVTSYGAIANYLGTKLSARMVGWAMNASSAAKPKVPAQRVVNRNGMLSGKHQGRPAIIVSRVHSGASSDPGSHLSRRPLMIKGQQ